MGCGVPKLFGLVNGGCLSLRDDGIDNSHGSIHITKEKSWETLETTFPHGLQTISHCPMAPLGPGRMQLDRSITMVLCPQGKTEKILLVMATAWKDEGRMWSSPWYKGKKMNKSQESRWGKSHLSHGFVAVSTGINHNHYHWPENKGNWPKNAIVSFSIGNPFLKVAICPQSREAQLIE